MKKRLLLGEFIGTFIMMFFGLGAGLASTVTDSKNSSFSIALLWGIAIIVAIYVTRFLSGAHFNPAVSVAMVIRGKLPLTRLPLYIIGQFTGAAAAAFTVYFIFSSSLEAYESANNIVRGSYESIATAKLFGEYYNRPDSIAHITMPHAAAAEALGTFILITVIFCLTDENFNERHERPSENLSPILIGLTVTCLICLISPITQAGFNPVRDFAPRLVTMTFGWGNMAFPDSSGGFFFVYILSPIIVSAAAALNFKYLILPIVKSKQN
jgi:glycerol uptake facilitator protein